METTTSTGGPDSPTTTLEAADSPAALGADGPGAEHADSVAVTGVDASPAGAAVGSAGDASEDDVDPEREGDVAADYLEELLDIADLDGDIDLDVEGDRAVVSLVGGDLDVLVGPGGSVLEALQELIRLAVLRSTGQRSRLLLDVAGWRQQRREQIRRQATEAVATVTTTGTPLSLPAMTPYERKIVHDVVAELGLASASEGQDAARHVVVRPS